MKNLIRTAILTGALATAGTAHAVQPIDDGPCPAGSYWLVPTGAAYHNDFWYTADGVLFGYAIVEDECWTPASKFA